MSLFLTSFRNEDKSIFLNKTFNILLFLEIMQYKLSNSIFAIEFIVGGYDNLWMMLM